jgi:hypothetical protein
MPVQQRSQQQSTTFEQQMMESKMQEREIAEDDEWDQAECA